MSSIENDLPLYNEIYAKFKPIYNNMTFITGFNIIMACKEDPWTYGPQVILCFDRESSTFRFDYKDYSVAEFKRVLNLLVFK